MFSVAELKHTYVPLVPIGLIACALNIQILNISPCSDARNMDLSLVKTLSGFLYRYFGRIKVCDSIEEVKVWLHNEISLNSCQSYRYVVKHVSYECCKNEPLMPLKTMSIFSSVLGVLYILLSNFTII